MIDNGTGYTKMGYSGNCEPNFIVPTLIATKEDKGNQIRAKSDDIPDLDFYIGNEVRSGCTARRTHANSRTCSPPPPCARAPFRVRKEAHANA